MNILKLLIKKIILDYGGPNIGKPLHVGHLRSLNIGRSLYNINKIAGHDVLNDIHLGDWGMPIAQIICYMKKIKLIPIVYQSIIWKKSILKHQNYINKMMILNLWHKK